MAGDRSLPRDIWYAAAAAFGLVLAPLSLCIFEGKSFTYNGTLRLIDWTVWLVILIGFVLSLAQAVSLSEIAAGLANMKRRGLRSFAYRLIFEVGKFAGKVGSGERSLFHAIFAFAHGVGVCLSVIATLVAAFAFLQSATDSIDSFLEAPVGTKPGHVNTGFGAEWWLYALAAGAVIVLTWVLSRIKQKLRDICREEMAS